MLATVNSIKSFPWATMGSLHKACVRQGRVMGPKTVMRVLSGLPDRIPVP